MLFGVLYATIDFVGGVNVAGTIAILFGIVLDSTISDLCHGKNGMRLTIHVPSVGGASPENKSQELGVTFCNSTTMSTA